MLSAASSGIMGVSVAVVELKRGVHCLHVLLPCVGLCAHADLGMPAEPSYWCAAADGWGSLLVPNYAAGLESAAFSMHIAPLCSMTLHLTVLIVLRLLLPCAASDQNYCVTSHHLAKLMAMTVSSTFAGTLTGMNWQGLGTISACSRCLPLSLPPAVAAVHVVVSVSDSLRIDCLLCSELICCIGRCRGSVWLHQSSQRTKQACVPLQPPANTHPLCVLLLCACVCRLCICASAGNPPGVWPPGAPRCGCWRCSGCCAWCAACAESAGLEPWQPAEATAGGSTQLWRQLPRGTAGPRCVQVVTVAPSLFVLCGWGVS
mgnify:CR=1 FL=1